MNTQCSPPDSPNQEELRPKKFFLTQSQQKLLSSALEVSKAAVSSVAFPVFQREMCGNARASQCPAQGAENKAAPGINGVGETLDNKPPKYTPSSPASATGISMGYVNLSCQKAPGQRGSLDPKAGLCSHPSVTAAPSRTGFADNKAFNNPHFKATEKQLFH